MQDFVEAAKRAAASAADRATWEMNRRQRAYTRQREVDLARRERGTLVEQVAHLVLQLDANGKLNEPSLHALCERLRTLESEIATGADEVRHINQQAYAPGAAASPLQSARPARVPAARPGEYPCPTCGKPVKDAAAFCSSCGTRLR
jgi:hypothetical protein